MAQEEGEVRKIRKKYFEDLYDRDTKEQVKYHMYSFDGIQRGNYFGGEPVGRAEVVVRVGLNNGKAALKIGSLEK